MKILKIILCFVVICCMFQINCNFNQIVKVLHHKGGASERSQKLQDSGVKNIGNMELGNVVFYCSQKPKVNYVPQREEEERMEGGFLKKRFIFPHAQITDKRLVEQINNVRVPEYKLKIEKINAPIKGVQFTLIYNPKKVTFNYKFFDSISSYKGVVFSFYNKDIINKLKCMDDCILRTVYSLDETKKKIVIVDCGHGGSDFGAISTDSFINSGVKSLREKDVTLSIGVEVARLLKKKGFEVSFTRDCDKTVNLNERTSFANRLNCQNSNKIFVSIHANSCLNNRASGLETFYPDDSLFQEGLFFSGVKEQSIIKKILKKRYEESFLLSTNLQKNIYNFTKAKDRGVKKTASQILLGAHMPCVIVEVGFLSNKKEAKLLRSFNYQKNIAQGICGGIVSYFDHKRLS